MVGIGRARLAIQRLSSPIPPNGELFAISQLVTTADKLDLETKLTLNPT